MSEVVTLARTARQTLAQGLSALQAPGVPSSLGATAEPVARAMGLLHQIENGADNPVDAANSALDAVRAALGSLQAAGEDHEAVNQAMEMVANSLGVVHQMTRTSNAPPTASRPSFSVPRPAGSRTASVKPLSSLVASASAAPQPAQQVAPASSVTRLAAASKPAPPAETVAAPMPQAAPAAEPAAQLETAKEQPAMLQPNHAAPPAGVQPAPPEQATNNAPAAPLQSPTAEVRSTESSGASASTSAGVSQPPSTEVSATGSKLAAEAALGAHSATNFYKGLSGNDVIDSGGIFVATYNLPAIGQELRLKVCMPGGYEFEADGIVRWCRDTPKSMSMAPFAPPGYGAQFTEISKEARQLVYRYVRNREPLFHDDL